MNKSGILLDTIIIEKNITELGDNLIKKFSQDLLLITKPYIKISRDRLSVSTYKLYRSKLTSACADAVIIENGKVPMILRAKPPFKNCWWVMGGTILTLYPVKQFLLWKVAKECGLTSLSIEQFITQNNLRDDSDSCMDITIVTLIGVYRTIAEDTEALGTLCDTINLCYLATYNGQQPLYHDSDHTAIRLFDLKDLVPGVCGHWYPERVARLALEAYGLARK